MKNLLVIFLMSVLACAGISADNPKTSFKAKVDRIIIEKIELQDVKLSDAINKIKELCKEADPDKKGINISYIAPKDDNGKSTDPVIRNEISLTKVPLKDLLRYICDETGMSYKIDEFAIMIYPKNMAVDKMETRKYPVAPGTVDTIEKVEKDKK